MINCKHLSNGICLVSSEMAGIDIPTTEDACNSCLISTLPSDKNFVTASLCRAHCRLNNVIPLANDAYLKSLLKVGLAAQIRFQTIDFSKIGSGVGTGLHKILKERGWEVEENCPCLEMILKMNREGSEWCRQNAQIIINSMVTEWQRRFKYAAYIMPKWLLNTKASDLVELAIANYESNKTVP